MPARNKHQAILVIDREPNVNAIVREILTSEGYRAIAAPNLDAAVDLLSSVKVSLVITDYMELYQRRGTRWPVLELFKQLVDPGTPFIVMTKDPEALRVSAQGLGVADVIAKPFEIGDLLERVNRAIAGRRSQ